MRFPASLLLLTALASLGAAENLVLNGSFEEADPTDATQPNHWGRIDGLGVRWAPAPPDTAGVSAGKALRFDTSISERDMVARWKAMGSTEWDVPDPATSPIGASYGLSLYSDAMPIKPATPYLVTVRHRGPGGGKIWVRGYAKRGDAMKRVYEAQTELPAGKDWRETTYAFDPTRHTPQVTEVKIMLYAYWPAAESWFDDVGLRVATAEELATEDARKKR